MFGGTVNEETFHYAQEYFFYISLGIPFYMFGQAMNPVIRADGNPRFAMISTLAGAVLNIIFDPIFIFECKMGHDGRGGRHRVGPDRHGGACGVVSLPHEDPSSRGRETSACTQASVPGC